MIKGFGDAWQEFAQHWSLWRRARDIFVVMVARQFEEHANDDYRFSLQDWLQQRGHCVDQGVDQVSVDYVGVSAWADAIDRRDYDAAS